MEIIANHLSRTIKPKLLSNSKAGIHFIGPITSKAEVAKRGHCVINLHTHRRCAIIRELATYPTAA